MTFTPQFFLALALGLGLLAFGWTLVRYGVNAVGFSSGFIFGYSLYQLVVQVTVSLNAEWIKFFPNHPAVPFFAGAVFGIIGLFLAKRIYLVAIFIGALAGSLHVLYNSEQRRLLDQAFDQVGILEPLNRTVGSVWPAILAILIALLFVYLERQMIILITACIGAYILADTLEIYILFLPLCFIGYLLQQTARRTKKRKAVAESE